MYTRSISPPLRSQSLQPHSPTSPRSVVRYNAFEGSSTAPASPSRVARDAPSVHGEPTPEIHPEKTKSREITGDGMMEHDDSEDPHDLALPTRHVATTSIVDNLVMSLDRFAPLPASRPVRSSTSDETKARSAFRMPRAKMNPPKARPEHGMAKDGEHGDTAAVEGDHPLRSETPDTTRVVVPPKILHTTTLPRSRSSSNASSVDLNHLAAFAGRMGAAGNRRSQSFDFGSTRTRSVLETVDLVADTARTPSTTAQMNPANGVSGSSPVQQVANTRKRRSGTIGTATLKPRSNTPVQPPFKNAISDSIERNMASPLPQTPSNTKPGFFRRVFGSSKNIHAASNASTGTSIAAPRPSQDHPGTTLESNGPSSPGNKNQKTSAKPAANTLNKENQPVIQKKPSSFFRRRKKSISEAAPPPLPLTLSNDMASGKVEDGARSPVSSLRAFMDPYLAEGKVESTIRHVRGSSHQSMEHAVSSGQMTPRKQKSRKSSLSRMSGSSPQQQYLPNGKSLSKLQIPDDGTTGNDDSATPGQSQQTSPYLHLASGRQAQDISHSPSGMEKEKAPPVLSRANSPPVNSSSRPTYIDRSPSTTSAGHATIRRETSGSVSSARSPSHIPSAAAESDPSIYKSAPSTPLVAETPRSPHVHVSHPSISQGLHHQDETQARKIFEKPEEEIEGKHSSSWLGDAGPDRSGVRKAYMEMFDWSNRNILVGLRGLCSKLALKGESQQVDRILDAFANRWCECNSSHGFKSVDVVHTICYSLLLLNTDLHMADIGQKMTKSQFIKNAMVPIKQVVADSLRDGQTTPSLLGVGPNRATASSAASLRPSMDRDTRSPSALSARPTERLTRETSQDADGSSGPLVDSPHVGTMGGWEVRIEAVLKDFYTSISREPLPLSGSQQRANSVYHGDSHLGVSGLRRTPSTLSKAHSDVRTPSVTPTSRSLGARIISKARSRPRLGTSAFGSSRTSLDDGSSAWSPSMSSTWSRVSLGKTLTSMSVDSFATEHTGNDYQSSIGFANALSQAIIRDEHMDAQSEEGIKAAPLLEDESLELFGAPWAKEGMVKHKCHLEGSDKKSKDRNWNDCFAVVEKGWVRLFSFSTTAKSLRNKAKNPQPTGVVGGGNWQDNAEEVWKFMLRHTIASALPPPGYSKLRPYVWALSLPNGAVHLFSVGTPDITKEFVSTANFWSARLSKEPRTGAVGSMEYGWSDNVINRALIGLDNRTDSGSGVPRPSTQMSIRSSIDHGGVRARLPGDRTHISEWNPPQQTLVQSQLMEVDQLKALQTYVKNIEEDLTKHNELRGPMSLAFTNKHPNSQKARTNWEKKSSYLLREIVKFNTYIEALQNAQKEKQKVYRMKKEVDDDEKDARAEAAFRKANEM